MDLAENFETNELGCGMTGEGCSGIHLYAKASFVQLSKLAEKINNKCQIKCQKADLSSLAQL